MTTFEGPRIDKDISFQDVYILERLFSSSLVALVSNYRPYRLEIIHVNSDYNHSHNYNGKILGVRLNRDRLVVGLEDSFYIHNIHDMQLLRIIDDEPNNNGVFDLDLSTLKY